MLEVNEKHELGAARATPLRLDDADLRRGHRQGRLPHPLLRRRNRARDANTPPGKPTARFRCTRSCYPRIEQDEKLAFVYGRIEMPLLPVLFRMERNGVLLDKAKLEAQSHELGKEILAIEQKAFAAAGQPFNLGSPKQIQEILFERQKLPVKKKTPSGQPSTDEDVARRAGARPSAAEADPRVPRAREAQVHLHRQAAAQRAPARPGACTPPTRRPRRSPGGSPRTTRTCRTSRSARAQGRRIRECLHRAAGREDRLGRLLADRAAHHGAPLRRRRACGAPSPHGDDVHRATAAEVFGVPLEKVDRGRAAHGEGDQLRPHLRHVAPSAWRRTSASSAPPRRPTSTPTSRAIRA